MTGTHPPICQKVSGRPGQRTRRPPMMVIGMQGVAPTMARCGGLMENLSIAKHVHRCTHQWSRRGPDKGNSTSPQHPLPATATTKAAARIKILIYALYMPYIYLYTRYLHLYLYLYLYISMSLYLYTYYI